MGWKEVSRDQFFATVNQMDVTPWPTGNYPYTDLWKTRGGQVVGKTVGYHPEGSGLTATRYMLLS